MKPVHNNLKAEIDAEKEKLQQNMDKYFETEEEAEEMLMLIAKIVAYIGIF